MAGSGGAEHGRRRHLAEITGLEADLHQPVVQELPGSVPRFLVEDALRPRVDEEGRGEPLTTQVVVVHRMHGGDEPTIRAPGREHLEHVPHVHDNRTRHLVHREPLSLPVPHLEPRGSSRDEQCDEVDVRVARGPHGTAGVLGDHGIVERPEESASPLGHVVEFVLLMIEVGVERPQQPVGQRIETSEHVLHDPLIVRHMLAGPDVGILARPEDVDEPLEVRLLRGLVPGPLRLEREETELALLTGIPVTSELIIAMREELLVGQVHLVDFRNGNPMIHENCEPRLLESFTERVGEAQPFPLQGENRDFQFLALPLCPSEMPGR